MSNLDKSIDQTVPTHEDLQVRFSATVSAPTVEFSERISRLENLVGIESAPGKLIHKPLEATTKARKEQDIEELESQLLDLEKASTTAANDLLRARLERLRTKLEEQRTHAALQRSDADPERQGGFVPESRSLAHDERSVSGTAIKDGTTTCNHTFRALATYLEQSDATFRGLVDPSSLEDEYGRFRVWSGNLGAQQKGHSSLDYRLRDSPLLQSNVLKLLHELKSNLNEAIAVVSGARLPYEQQAVSAELSDDDDDDDDDDSIDSSVASSNNGDSDEEERPKTELQQRMLDVVDIVDNLYKLSIRIRSPALRARSLKAATFRPVDQETGVDLFSQYAKYDAKFVRDAIAQLRKEHSVEQHEDVEYLLERLSNAITKRRQQFKYWKKHRDKLSGSTRVEETDMPEPGPAPRPTSETEENVLAARLKGNARISDLILGAPGSDANPKTLLSATEATAHNRTLDEAVDSQSVTSIATTARDMSGQGIELPPPPNSADGEKDFECPYCFVICPARYGRGRAWRMHLLQDLQPYLCTYPDCVASDQLFRSRREWLEHESSAHRKLWRCPYHTEAVFATSAGLKNHLQNAHGDELSEQHLDSAVGIGGTSAIDARQTCPICSADAATVKNFENHIANHLERFAAFALPRQVGSDEEKSAASNDASLGRGGSSQTSRNSSQNWTINSSASLSSNDGLVWPLSQVLGWLTENGFPKRWQDTFRTLGIEGSSFLELGQGAHLPSKIAEDLSHTAALNAERGRVWAFKEGLEESNRLHQLVKEILENEGNPATAASNNQDVETIHGRPDSPDMPENEATNAEDVIRYLRNWKQHSGKENDPMSGSDWAKVRPLLERFLPQAGNAIEHLDHFFAVHDHYNWESMEWSIRDASLINFEESQFTPKIHHLLSRLKLLATSDLQLICDEEGVSPSAIRGVMLNRIANLLEDSLARGDSATIDRISYQIRNASLPSELARSATDAPGINADVAIMDVLLSADEVRRLGMEVSADLRSYADTVLIMDRDIIDGITTDLELMDQAIEGFRDVLLNANDRARSRVHQLVDPAHEVIKACRGIFQKVQEIIEPTKSNRFALPLKAPTLRLLRKDLGMLNANFSLLTKGILDNTQIDWKQVERDAAAIGGPELRLSAEAVGLVPDAREDKIDILLQTEENAVAEPYVAKDTTDVIENPALPRGDSRERVSASLGERLEDERSLDPQSTLHISNIPEDATKEDVAATLSILRGLENIYYDKQNGSQGYAKFRSTADAKRALEFVSELSLPGIRLVPVRSVNFAQPPDITVSVDEDEKATEEPFIQKLSSVLRPSKKIDEVIRWSRDGHVFMILDQERLTKEILTQEFGLNDFESFVDQLKRHGFRRTFSSSDSCSANQYSNSWFHKYFISNKPELRLFIRASEGTGGDGPEYESILLEPDGSTLSVKTLSNIPPITVLYKNGMLKAASTEELPRYVPAFAPNEAHNQKISLLQHDITKLSVDAIVNAATRDLSVGLTDSLSYHIHQAAGMELSLACSRVDLLKPGEAIMTQGYRLPCRAVIHTVRPHYYQVQSSTSHKDQLAICYRNCLALTVQQGLKSVAFPCLSTGGFGFPAREAAEIALRTTREFLDDGRGAALDRIVFCVYRNTDVKAYRSLIPVFFPATLRGDSSGRDRREG